MFWNVGMMWTEASWIWKTWWPKGLLRLVCVQCESELVLLICLKKFRQFIMKAQALLKSKGWSGWVRFTVNATESSERVKCDVLLVSLAFTGWTISPGRIGHYKYCFQIRWLATCRTNCVDKKYLAERRPWQTHEKWENWVDVEIVQGEYS